jgi:hypothetical protein
MSALNNRPAPGLGFLREHPAASPAGQARALGCTVAKRPSQLSVLKDTYDHSCYM